MHSQYTENDVSVRNSRYVQDAEINLRIADFMDVQGTPYPVVICEI